MRRPLSLTHCRLTPLAECAHGDFGPARIVTAFLRDADRVLLCHRSAQRRWYPDVWDLPGGHVEPEELLAAALARELREGSGGGVTSAAASGSPRAAAAGAMTGFR